jgi:hypothetical protein
MAQVTSDYNRECLDQAPILLLGLMGAVDERVRPTLLQFEDS